jgi:hypothetical protein
MISLCIQGQRELIMIKAVIAGVLLHKYHIVLLYSKGPNHKIDFFFLNLLILNQSVVDSSLQKNEGTCNKMSSC